MQGYQNYKIASMAGNLIDPCAAFWSSPTERAVDGGPLAVPGSPGHVRRLRPYPPSRRRRR
ncbi:MAG TPA: hypothetical protein VFB12_07335 [Ktedonobacteraceae bacterium]|nr:hypothetical protein [Ktedonobacteraceae bacterium]